MRSAIGCVLGVLITACGSDNPGPALSISPSGTVQTAGPVELTAILANTTADVTWSTDGGGSLSNATGLHVTYRPPPGSETSTLTATADKLTAQVVIVSGPATLNSATIPGLTAPVTVQYDAEDIPHIQCAAAIDCFAVQGYVQARDRWFQMDFLRHVARSNLAELVGVAGLAQDEQFRTLFVTRAGHRLESDLAAALDPATRKILEAFAGGINAYLAELRASGAQLPGEYQQLPFPLTPADVADWTVEDTEALARLQQLQLSFGATEEIANGQFAAVYAQGPLADLGKLNAWMRAAAPASEQAHTLAPGGFTVARTLAATRAPSIDLSPWRAVLGAAVLHAGPRHLGGLVGSNNWAVSTWKSAAHFAMVANDPHLALQYPPLFHLAVMTSANPADSLDLAGGSFPGLPGALVGRGAHVGWGVTVVGYDVTDVYLEQFLPQAMCATPAPCVLFNGAPVATIPVPQHYRVRIGPGDAFADQTGVVLVVPHHGPVIQAPDASGRAVSVRWTGHEGNTQDLKAFLGLDTAADVDAAMVALKDFATGAQNFVLADDMGHIAYDPHALVPVRQFADIRVRGANVILPWLPLPGDGTAEWGDGVANCASATLTPLPASCWIADDLLPHGKDPAKGYYFTANADPTYPSVSDDNNPLAHPPYLSFSWSDSTGFRATRIDQLLSTAIAANGRVSLADMEAMQADHMSRPGALFGPFVAAIPVDASSPPELALAQQVFAAWAANGYDCPSGLLGIDPVNSAVDPNPAVAANSAGCTLFHAFLRRLLNSVFADDLAVVGQGVDDVSAIKGIVYLLGLPAGAPGTTFCNDVDATGQTIAPHTCMEQVANALVFAVDTLTSHVGPPSEWVWGRYHTVTPVSAFGMVTVGYEPGPYAHGGGAWTVDVAAPSLDGAGLDFTYGHGGQVRHISVLDPTAPSVRMQLPGPERDNPAVFVGPDLLGGWLTNTYFDFAYGAQIDRAVVSTQTFTAQ
ncbi:MAG: penicillin acylase family protein [Acidobacteriota bacterium]